MIPIVTPAEMAEIDRLAPESSDVLIRRAATSVARVATQMMGGSYGRRVLVVAGPGNNGEDGRVAAEILAKRGVRATVVDPVGQRSEVSSQKWWPVAGGRRDVAADGFDLIIDAAYGTGFRGGYEFPFVTDKTPVLAVDLVSGVSGLNGLASGRPVRADRTVTFAALKPGHLFADGAELSGTIEVADIRLDVSGARAHLVESSDLTAHLPERSRVDHKWRHAVWLVAGSPGMSGAARLGAGAALRSGSGYVRVSSPGVEDPSIPVEAVGHPLPVTGWADLVAQGADRFAVVTVGPGLGTAEQTRAEIRKLASFDGFPLVVDGDGLSALGADAAEILYERRSPTVLTPHDGEYERLVGEPPGVDRIAATRHLAERLNSVVLLKGPATVVADPSGRVLISDTGDARLATAGTGDVLTGVISAQIAMGAEPVWAAAGGAHLHGLAGFLGTSKGLVAGDLLDLLPRARLGI